MIAFVDELFEALKDDMELLKEKHTGILELSRQSIQLIEESVEQLKLWVRAYKFRNTAEEVDFFRNSLPQFYSELIYHVRLYYLETNRCGSTQKIFKNLLYDELKWINLFLKRRMSFKQYYSAGDTFLDEQLFTRQQTPLPHLQSDYSLALDNTFCTTHSLLLSEIKAFERLQAYLSGELSRMQHSGKGMEEPKIVPQKWRLGPFALTELGYMLHLTGAFPGTLKSTMDFIGQCFDTPIHNYSRILQQMRIRKNERAAYLAKGIRQVHEHMDELDDKIQ